MWLCECARQISELAGWPVSTNASSGFSERLSQNKVEIGGARCWTLASIHRRLASTHQVYFYTEQQREREWEVHIFIELDSWTFDL